MSGQLANSQSVQILKKLWPSQAARLGTGLKSKAHILQNISLHITLTCQYTFHFDLRSIIEPATLHVQQDLPVVEDSWRSSQHQRYVVIYYRSYGYAEFSASIMVKPSRKLTCFMPFHAISHCPRGPKSLLVSCKAHC